MADSLVIVRIQGLEEVRGLLRKLPEKQFDGAKKEFDRAAQNVHGAVSRRIESGTPLHSRTGALRRSLTFRTYGQAIGSLHSDVWSDIVYAPIHEKGGTITAKQAYRTVPGGPYLNIPLPANLTPSGVMRRSARDVFAAGGYLIESRAGNWLVMLDEIPQFVLKRRVTIPPRLGLQEEGEKEVPHLLSRLKDIPLE